MRTLAVIIAIVVAVLAVGASTQSSMAIVALLIAFVVTVSTNGLAFTAVAEYAGPSWAGRALGVQNTAQNLVAAATPPAIAAVIAAGGYGAAFATNIAFPLLAAALVPLAAERTRASTTVAPRPATAGGD